MPLSSDLVFREPGVGTRVRVLRCKFVSTRKGLQQILCVSLLLQGEILNWLMEMYVHTLLKGYGG